MVNEKVGIRISGNTEHIERWRTVLKNITGKTPGCKDRGNNLSQIYIDVPLEQAETFLRQAEQMNTSGQTSGRSYKNSIIEDGTLIDNSEAKERRQIIRPLPLKLNG
jgi:hypothetical protein